MGFARGSWVEDIYTQIIKQIDNIEAQITIANSIAHPLLLSNKK